MKIPLKIKFVDFYQSFQITDLFFIKDLADKYDLIMVDENPQIVVCSVMSNQSQKYSCPKILFSGENLKTYFCPRVDAGFITNTPKTFYSPNRNAKFFYLPHGVCWYDPLDIKKLHQNKSEQHWREILASKKKFCCFVTSNGNTKMPGVKSRIELFNELNKYKPIDSAGSVLNNMPNGEKVPHENFVSWVSQYKFILCFENTSAHGYFTEKPFTALLANTIPIYWSHSSVFNYLDKNSMIFFDGIKSTIDRVKYLDQNDDEYLKMISNYPLLVDPEQENSVFNRKFFSKKFLEAIESLINK